MNRTDTVKTEVRKLASSKPVHAAASAGALASAAIRDLPAKIARWRTEVPGMASGYVATARTKAVQEYDKLAVHGEQVLHHRTALDGESDTGAQS